MPEVGLPPVDYRRFLSDVASGFTVLVFIVVIIPYFRETLKKWIMINYNLAIAIIIAAIIISPAIGFAINAISYAFLDKAVKMFAGERIFHEVLNKLNIVNYRNILEFKDEFEKINHYFNLKNSLPIVVTNERNQEYKDLLKSLEEIEDKLIIERPGIIGEGIEAVHGGYIMLRNIAYLMLVFALFFFLLPLLSLLFSKFPLFQVFNVSLDLENFKIILSLTLAILFTFLFSFIDNKIIIKIKNILMTRGPIFIVISIMLLLILPILLSIKIPDNNTFICPYIAILFSFIAILFSFSLLMLFLSTLALVYYHWHVFLAALHVARKRW